MSADKIEAILDKFQGELSTVKNRMEVCEGKMGEMSQEIQDVDQKASTAMSNVTIEKAEREEEMQGMQGDIEKVHKLIADTQEKTTVLVSQLQMNVQNQLKTAVSEETFNTIQSAI